MAFDQKPSTWLDDWSEDGTDITVPLATFPEMTADEADAEDGDIRKVLFAIAEKLYDSWNNTATADRPTQMYIAKSSSVNTTTGVVTNTYTLRFYCEINTQEVKDES